MNIKNVMAIFMLGIMPVSQIAAEVKQIEVTSDVDVNIDSAGQSTAEIMIKKIDGEEVQVINKSYEIGADTDVDALVESLLSEHNIQLSGDHDKRIIKIDNVHNRLNQSPKARLGFMASVKKNGWEILSITPDSGAEDAGLKAGDLITSIDGDTTGTGKLSVQQFAERALEAGDLVDVAIKRGENEMSVTIQAEVLTSPDVLMQLNTHFDSLRKSVEDINITVDSTDDHVVEFFSNVNPDNINVVTTGDADAYFFSHSQLSQWLGSRHHFSSITPGLGQYFGTEDGVLVLEVDPNNALGLKDGDVIEQINGVKVHSPKDVVKQLKNLDEDASLEIQVIRQKKKIYLAS